MKYNYHMQADNNISSLFEDEWFYGRRKSVLLKVVDSFKKHNVKWSLLCSSQLFFKGVVDDFNDFDILIEYNSIENMREAMKELGAKSKAQGDQSCFGSSMFERYVLDDIDLDMVSNYTVTTFGKRYRYSYSEDETEFLKEQEIIIPLIAMEAQYLLYGMMEGWQPKRRLKRVMIESYLKSEGIKHPQILRKALEEETIPPFLTREVKKMITK